MTRVLCWNVNNFSSNGFYPPPGARPRAMGDDGNYGVPAAAQDATDRKAVLLATVTAAQPDLISVIEVKPGMIGLPAASLLIDQAALGLLADLQGLAFAGAAEYRLVPPLVSGVNRRAEGIAVYYRSDRLQFLGPWGWSGAAGMPMAALPGGETAEYPLAWDTLRSREIPAGWMNEGLWEDELAGQCAFVNGGALNFPGPNHRKPWLTCFRDFSNPAAQRLVKLLSFHAPPDVDVVEGCDNLADIMEVAIAPLAANEVRCVIGDFNINSLDAQESDEAFGELEEAGFTMRFNPNPANVGPHDVPERGYYITILKRAQDSTPWISDDHGAKVFGYPPFDYMGSYALDNAFTCYGAGAGAPANATVLNPVTHSPYNLVAPPPGLVPPGTIATPSTMNEPNVFHFNPPGEMGIDGYDMNADELDNEFREWANYMHIRSCSDHLPVALDI
jgi:hypothetical protein